MDPNQPQQQYYPTPVDAPQQQMYAQQQPEAVYVVPQEVPQQQQPQVVYAQTTTAVPVQQTTTTVVQGGASDAMDPTMVLLLDFFIPGLGHILNKLPGGVIILVIFLLSYLLLFLYGIGWFIFVIVQIALHVFAMYDGYVKSVAKKNGTLIVAQRV